MNLLYKIFGRDNIHFFVYKYAGAKIRMENWEFFLAEYYEATWLGRIFSYVDYHTETKIEYNKFNAVEL